MIYMLEFLITFVSCFTIGESLQARAKMGGKFLEWWSNGIAVYIIEYLMGYVEKGGGAWEFRATYVCIELRMGAYPFQKFRRYHGMRKKVKKDGRVKYELLVSLNGVKIYFQEQKTIEQAALIRDVAMFCLDINGRHGSNFHQDFFFSLSKISYRFPHDQIKSLILQYAKGLPTWKHMTTNASPLCPSNTPNEDARMAGFNEFIREFHEVPLQLSFDNQFQEVVDVEGSVTGINGDFATLQGVEHEMIPTVMNDLHFSSKLH